MFHDSFSHYLTYGATDQQTVRELSDAFTGLIVPGTVAAFQREGTGGFVLTLSATDAAPEYVIDPRFPLFQQPLVARKRSHEALAELLGEPGLVSTTKPNAKKFNKKLVSKIGKQWAAFNLQYQESVSAKFEKYAKRLNEEVQLKNRKAPSYILPPYTIAGGPKDPWWEVAERLYDATVDAAKGGPKCIRVVATDRANALGELLEAVRESEVAIWVSGLNELSGDSVVLAEYLGAIEQGCKNGHALFALYGGFFSVLAASVGLGGSCHGIGYGEYREWLELPTSGPAPARYYLPQLHRYVPQDFAYQLWLKDKKLAECTCDECQGRPPIALDYHSLMKHSVRCRAMEIESWIPLSLAEMNGKLRNELAQYMERIQAAKFSSLLHSDAMRYSKHLEVWSGALDQVA